MKHILIDYENIQPRNFDSAAMDECHLWLFLGVNQQKSLPLELVETLLRFDNKNVHIIKMQHAGKNALDFYLSFYLGKISEIDSQADVCILARDSGYDVLIEHLNTVYNGLNIVRLADTNQLNPNDELDKVTITTTATPKVEKNKTSATIYQRAIASIKERPTSARPSKKSSLTNYLKSHLRGEDSKVIDNLIKQMIVNEIITVSNTNKLSYKI